MHAKSTYKSGIHFESEAAGFKFQFDGAAEHGGQGLGPSPKEGMLASMCACTGMDVSSLLKKFGVAFSSFEVTSRGKLRAAHPQVFELLEVEYALVADAAREKDIVKAIELSMSRYSPIAAALAQVTAIAIKIQLNGSPVYSSEAKFPKLSREM